MQSDNSSEKDPPDARLPFRILAGVFALAVFITIPIYIWVIAGGYWSFAISLLGAVSLGGAMGVLAYTGRYPMRVTLKEDDQLEDAWERAESYSGDASVPSLRQMCLSDDPDTRILGLLLVRQQINSKGHLSEHFDIARQLIEDQNNVCRWQSIIVIGEFIESDPESVWEVAVQFGVSEDEDMRTAVATILLEHLLEYHFDTYFPRVRSLILSGSLNFADTLSRCSPLGDAKSHWDEVKTVLAEALHAGSRMHCL